MSAIAIASGGSALTPATGNISLFVATTGSDSNDGSAAHPFATIQHAVSVLLSFDFQSLYQGTISVAAGTYHEEVIVSDGIFLGSHQRTSPSAFIIGDTVTPTNVVIQPNDGTGNTIMQFLGGFWSLAGFSLTADATGSSSDNGAFVQAVNTTLALGNLDFNTGTGQTYAELIASQTYSGIGVSGSSATWTIRGDGAQVNPMIDLVNFSRLVGSITITFNSAINLGGNPFITSFNTGYVDLRSYVFVNPGNITGGQVALLNGATTVLVGADPATITWPSGPFSNSTISETATIDGFTYSQGYAGAPVDESSIYRGSWQIHKDTNQATATRGLALWADDAGSLFPLTPPVTTFANLPATPLVGMRAAITDGLAGNCADGTCTTWGTNVTGGGGALNLLIWYNGAHWTLTGK